MRYIILKKVSFANEDLITVLIADEKEKKKQEEYYKNDILDIYEFNENETNRIELITKKYVDHTVNDIIKE